MEEFTWTRLSNSSTPMPTINETPKCVLSIVSHRTFSSSECRDVRIEAVYDGSGTAVSTYRVVDGNRNIWFQGNREDCKAYLYGG